MTELALDGHWLYLQQRNINCDKNCCKLNFLIIVISVHAASILHVACSLFSMLAYSQLSESSRTDRPTSENKQRSIIYPRLYCIFTNACRNVQHTRNKTSQHGVDPTICIRTRKNMYHEATTSRFIEQLNNVMRRTLF